MFSLSNLFAPGKPKAIIRSYEDKGVVVAPKFFGPATTAKLTDLRDFILSGVEAGKIGRSGQLTQNMSYEAMGFLKKAPEILDMAKWIIGPNVSLLMFRVLMKDDTFSGSINHHQDWPYFGGDTRKLSFFIPLTPCNEENGQLVFYEGSHKMGPVERGDIDIKRYPEFKGTIPAIDLGDVLLADMLTWHASVPAQVVSPRIMIQMIVCPANDPCSEDVILGNRDPSALYCQTRLTPMRAPASNVSAQVAREFFGYGQYELSERICRGIIETEPNNIEAMLILHDLEKLGYGSGSAAQWCLGEANRMLEYYKAELVKREAIPAKVG